MLRISRAALYELVWAKPMTEIAREYGVRDLHIAKACDLHDIARPHGGYWQKIDAGKPVEKMPLVNDTFTADHMVTIDSTAWMAARTSSSSSKLCPTRDRFEDRSQPL